MKPDPDRDVIQAVARLLGNLGCPDPDAAALEVNVAYKHRGYKQIPGQSDPHLHGGAGLPTPGSDGERNLAAERARQKYRADAGTGRRP